MSRSESYKECITAASPMHRPYSRHILDYCQDAKTKHPRNDENRMSTG
jgi:hypothetical protein